MTRLIAADEPASSELGRCAASKGAGGMYEIASLLNPTEVLPNI